jgi:hypothetical protein
MPAMGCSQAENSLPPSTVKSQLNLGEYIPRPEKNRYRKDIATSQCINLSNAENL